MKLIVYLLAITVDFALTYGGVIWSVGQLNNLLFAGVVASVWGFACLIMSLNGARWFLARLVGINRT